MLSDQQVACDCDLFLVPFRTAGLNGSSKLLTSKNTWAFLLIVLHQPWLLATKMAFLSLAMNPNSSPWNQELRHPPSGSSSMRKSWLYLAKRSLLAIGSRAVPPKKFIVSAMAVALCSIVIP